MEKSAGGREGLGRPHALKSLSHSLLELREFTALNMGELAKFKKKTPKTPKPLNWFMSLFPIFLKLEKDSKISEDS